MIGFSDTKDAYERVRNMVLETPVIGSDHLSERYEGEVYLKLECLQKTGSFKVRGAFNRVLQMDADQRSRGIVTVSSGKHAVALSYVSKKLHIKVVAIMPRIAPKQVEAVKRHGAEIILHRNSYQETMELASNVVAQQNSVFVHSYDDPGVIADQGTIAIELSKQLKKIDNVVLGVGGGALFAGLALCLKNVNSEISLYAVQPKKASTIR